MANESKANEILGSVVLGASQITQLATAAVGLFGIYRQAREQWKAANPEQPDPFLTDLDLINALQGSAEDLVTLADRLLAKYQDPATPAGA